MKQDFVILPRDLVELALASLESEFGKHSKSASDIRTALEQPQGEHDPVAKVVLTEQLGLPCLQWLDLDRQFDFKGGELLYTRPQPKQEPLTDEEIDKLCPQFDDPMRREMWIIGFKAAHNIKD